MRKSQANRAVIAARAAGRVSTITPDSRVSHNPALRHKSVPPLRTVMRKSSAVKMTPVMRAGDGSGRRSEWTQSPDFFTDSAWDQTLSNRR